VISFTNNYVVETHGHTSMFSTVFIGIISLRDGRFTYINCGNEPALLVGSEGTVRELWPTGPIVGVIPNAEFSAKEIVIGGNDILLAYTDGVTDALNTSERAFGRGRLVDLLKGEGLPCEDLLKNIEGQLQEFIGEAVQFDDITALAIKKKMTR
jgi:serine phosphatase RsbU (regulator of sigma subunit)